MSFNLKSLSLSRTLIAVLVMTSGPFGANAQSTGVAPVGAHSLDKAKKYAALIGPAGLTARLEVLTADSLEGRETGEPGARKAAAYIASRFRAIGLRQAIAGTWFQKVPLTAQEGAKASIQAGTVRPVYLKDYVYVPSRNSNNASLKTASLTLLKLPSSADEMAAMVLPLTLKGKVVMLLPPANYTARAYTDSYSYVRFFLRMVAPLKKKSPAAILILDDNAPDLAVDPAFREAFLDKKTIIPEENKDTSPASLLFLLSAKTASSVLSQGGTNLAAVQAEFSSHTEQNLVCGFSVRVTSMETRVDAANVLGFLPGTDLKSEVLVISAHYDHLGLHNGKLYHGADDDGSGSAALMEIASAFSKAKKEGKGPRRSILFLANVGEEKGLLGSQYYSEHPVFPVAKTITDLNVDMIGRIDSAHAKDSAYVYVIGSGKLSSDLQKISESVNRSYGGLNLDYKFDDPQDPNQFYYRSDHYNFAKLGIPIIFYFNGVHADYHQPSDTIEKIAFGMYTRRARLIFYTAWELANREKRPFVDRVNDFK